MKETIKVNLGGQLFDLDADAYETLRVYLDTLQRTFEKSGDEATEIIEDIEIRISELLGEKIGPGKQVITNIDIKEIIQQLGTADDMDSTGVEDKSDNNSEPEKEKYRPPLRKRLYRDKDRSIAGGVAGGLAAYFNIDPVWIRIAFILLVFLKLAGVLIYVILWIIIPVAKTRAQKLEMQGKPINVDSIGDSVKGEFKKVKSKWNEMSEKKEYKNIESGLSEFFSVLGKIILAIFKAIVAIIAFGLIIGLVVLVIGLFIGGAFIFPDGMFGNINLPDALNWSQITVAGLCLILIITIPILVLFTKIVRWLFDIQNRNHFLTGIAATVWVIALIALIVVLVSDNNHKSFISYTNQSYDLDVSNEKTLYLASNEVDELDNHSEHYQIFKFSFIWDEHTDKFYKKPFIEISESEDNEVHLEVHRNIGHIDFDDRAYVSDVTRFDWVLKDSVLILDEYYSCEDEDAWRLPQIKLVLKIPEGMKINYDKDIANNLKSDEELYKVNLKKNANKTLIMTEDGLALYKN